MNKYFSLERVAEVQSITIWGKKTGLVLIQHKLGKKSPTQGGARWGRL